MGFRQSKRWFFSPYENPKLEDGKDGEELSMRLAIETGNFLKENNPKRTRQPVFAFLSFYAVHSPLQTTYEKWKKYQQKAIMTSINTTGFKMGHFLPMRIVQDNPVYAGLVESMDEAVGYVLKFLKELDLEQNTIIVFTSDNGGVFAGDGYATSNLPLRGGKGYQFEGGIRVPYFIKVPWLNIKNKRIDAPVTGADFYPTILDFAGQKLRPSEHKDGVSLFTLFRDEKFTQRSLIWHYPHYGNQGGEPSAIIRKDKWKLIHYYEDGHKELYNLEDDPEELDDISKQNQKIVTELNNELFEYLKNVNVKYPTKDPEYSEIEEMNHLENVRKVKLPQLEKQRIEFLTNDFDPGNNWWGSKLK